MAEPLIALGEWLEDNEDLVKEALDSHLYWQVCQDLSRRRDGYVFEPYTEEEQAVVNAIEQLEKLTK